MGNPVCLWQTELFKLNLKSSPSSSGYNRRRRLATRSSGKQQAERTAVRAASIVCPEESPLLAAIIDNFDVKNSPLMGIDAPTPARGEDLHPSWGTYLLRRRSEGGAGGRAESPPACMTRDNFAARNSPLMGIDAPTPARIGTGRSKGRSHFSFGGERKVCKRKPAARRLREKALYCPFLKEGVRNVARSTVELPTWTFVRARAHSFPLSKRARLFPSAAYRRSVPPQSAWGILTPCGLGCFDVAGRFCSVDEQNDFPFPVSGGHTYPLRGGMLRRGL